MAEVVVLGSSGALPTATRDNTYLAVRGDSECIMIDCGGSPIQRLKMAGIDPLSVGGLIVTHHHPDHIYGVPALVLGLWLMGRKPDLHIYGPLKAVASVSSLLDALDTRDWPGLFRIVFHAVQLTERFPVMETSDFILHATPVAHMVSCIALRCKSKKTGKVLVYSSDTEPCESLVRLGQDADILLHEATGAQQGHSSPAQAGDAARAMNAGRLVLVHLPLENGDEQAWEDEARRTYDGTVVVARDLSRFEW